MSKYKFTVTKGATGNCLTFEDDVSGTRFAGPKMYGIGETVEEFPATLSGLEELRKDITKAIRVLRKKGK